MTASCAVRAAGVRTSTDSSIPRRVGAFTAVLGLLFSVTTLIPNSNATGTTTPGAWFATNPMSRPRNGHTATVLPDGRVLVIGGQESGSAPTASAEFYGPATRTWVPTAPMGEARAFHTATLLANGDVLVTGGCRGPVDNLDDVCADSSAGRGEILRTAELFHAPSGTWTKVGDMATPRFGHTATRLATGRVLVAGGCVEKEGNDGLRDDGGRNCGPDGSGGENLSSSEIYRPDAQSWLKTGSMMEARAFHTAALLSASGEVLVAGGRTDASRCNFYRNTALATAERYEPDTVDPTTGIVGMWLPTGPMRHGRFWHTATELVSGKVLVAGGTFDYTDSGQPFCHSSEEQNRVRNVSTEVYDPTTALWSDGGPLPAPGRFRHSAVRLSNDKVLVMGGSRGGPDNGAFIPNNPSLFGSLATADVYNEATNTWSETRPMLQARMKGHASVLLPGGDVMVTGGVRREPGEPYSYLADAEVFDPTRMQVPSVVTVQPSGGPLAGGTTVTLTGVGFTNVRNVSFGSAAATFVPVSDTLMRATSPPASSAGAVHITVTVTDSSGRAQTSATIDADRFEYFPVGAGDWSPTASMGTPRQGGFAVLLWGPRCRESVLPSYCGDALVGGGANDRTSELYDVASRSWSPGPSMGTPLYGPTAVLLPSGRVLVAGGCATDAAPCDPLRSAELYDPGSGTWTPTGSMATGRVQHTATLLHDGRVLVTGGKVGAVDQAGVEFYDPETGTWSPGNPLVYPRAAHTATLLWDPNCSEPGLDEPAGNDCGSVLLAGGTQQNDEIYDPRTARSRAIPTTLGRRGHTVTVISGPACATAAPPVYCGAVLLAGGVDNSGSPSSSVQLFERGALQLRQVGSLAMARFAHSASVLPDGRVLVAGGQGAGEILASSEVYDPAEQRWRPGHDLNSKRAHHSTARLADGRILATGGNNDASAEVLVVDAAPVPALSRVHPAAGSSSGERLVVINGANLSPLRVVRFGDRDAQVVFSDESAAFVIAPAQPRRQVQLTVATAGATSSLVPFSYTPGGWTRTGILTGSYLTHDAAVLDGEQCSGHDPPSYCGVVLVAGTATNPVSTITQASAEVYNPAAATWTPTDAPAVARFDHTLTALPDGTALLVGGQSTLTAIPTTEVFDPAPAGASISPPGRWRPTSPVPTPRFSHTATRLPDGRVLVAGGAVYEPGRQVAVATAEIYDWRTGTWSPAAPMSSARANHTATVLPDGRVLVAGGYRLASPSVLSGDVVSSAEIYDWRTGRWTTTAPLAVGRFAHAATLLDGPACAVTSPSRCGRVLVVGGSDSGGGRSAAELYDPLTGRWDPVAPMRTPRAGHTASLLHDGGVLVMGSATIFSGHNSPAATRATEVYRPDTDRWEATEAAVVARGRGNQRPTATTLTGPPCRTASPPRYCGAVLVEGGDDSRMRSSDLYFQAPSITRIQPGDSPVGGGRTVAVTGTGFTRETSISVGDEAIPEDAVSIESATEIRLKVPPHAAGDAVVSAVDSGGTSAIVPTIPSHLIFYLGTPGAIEGLAASPASPTSIDLSFGAHDGSGLRPATEYVVKQSSTPIRTLDEFDAADALCGGTCRFARAQRVNLRVENLEPGTSYFYSVRAGNEFGQLGPVSESVSATTPTLPSTATCPAPVTAGLGQVSYPGGRYSLVAGPGGTVFGANSPLYTWRDQGAGGGYSFQEGNSSSIDGNGYWAYFRCPQLVTLAPTGQNGPLSVPLGAYHASMVGNPSGTSQSTVSGHDFAARWDPDANGYVLSGYRESQVLPPGEGIWTFSYVATSVTLSPA
ncbi:MAG TPA: kelch repeat-containing protein [Acidimicrobiales bacterium]|nr:kelch repeat-containing protein [Acidimicrobiales bacterium]